MRLIAVGDNVTDTYLDEGMYYPGGQAVNVSVDAMLSGAQGAGYLGVFGDDDRADYIRGVLADKGVSCERCRRAYAPTARPGVRLVDGERVFQSGPRDSCQHLFAMNIVREDLALLATYDVCHLTNEAHLESELATIRQSVPVSFDFSTDRDEAYLELVCPNVDIAFFSGADLAPEQVHALARRACELGVRVAVVTRGADGAYALERALPADGGAQPSWIEHEVSACEAQVVDTMGAGDSFAAAFLVRYYDTHDLAAALAFAAERAAVTCGVRGAFGCGHAC